MTTMGRMMALHEVREVKGVEAEQPIWMPPDLASALCSFLVDKKTGNVTLNIRDGKILGYRVEEIRSLK